MRATFSFVTQNRTRGLNHRQRRAEKRRQSNVSRQLERLESRVLMHADPVQDAEHLAVFGAMDPVTHVVTGGLVPDAALTYISVPSVTPENWSSPATWQYVGPALSGGAVPSPIPGAGANVLISAGSVVIVDANNAAALRTIRTDGTLRFDPHANTSLLVDTIIVEPRGVFQMGTDPTLPDPLSPTGHGERIDADKRAKVIFADRGPIDLAWDPLQFSRGLVSHGEVSIFGSEVTAFVPIDRDALAKSTTLVLAETPVGWRAGDRLILTGDTATDRNNVNHDEEVQIVSMGKAADGHTTVTITDPKVPIWGGLEFNHSVIAGYVANVTRNATFESQNVTTVARRGHIMFMHNHEVHVDAAGFYGLGRTDKRTLIDDPVLSPDPDKPGQFTTDVIDSKTKKRVMVPVLDASGNPVVINGVTQLEPARTGLNPRGRYAVHFHRAGIDPDEEPASIHDSAVVDSPGWGIVNHSSNVDVDGNVVFNAVGAAYVTEAGDELGKFNANIAIHSRGSGDGIESRERVQDFGHQGDGFWLQGGNVEVTNNVVSGQRHSGYVFFPVGLKQKGLGTTRIPVAELVNPAWAAPGETTIDVGRVPLRKFSGNVAFASGDGLETWFTLLDVSNQFADQQNLIEDFTTFGNSSSKGIFTPYTNRTTLRDVTVMGNINSPRGTAIARNDVTRNIVYDQVHAEGWEVGIDLPVNGVNEVNGGYFNDIKGLLITTANSRNRVVNINGNTDAAGNLDPSDPQFGTLTAKALNGRRQYDIALSSNFNPKENDITRLFNPDVIQMGTVTVNDKQLYYKQQAASFKPFNSSSPDGVASYVPAALVDLTNQEIYDQYGLAIGGIVAPASASASNPRIDGLIGDHVDYLPDLQLASKKYFNGDSGPYLLSYKYYDPANARPGRGGYVTVKETEPTPLVNGWNLIKREILGETRTLLVYGDNIKPTFVVDPDLPTTINIADINNGSTFVIQGTVMDNSFGARHFYKEIALNDPQFVSAVQTDATGSFVIVTFTIKDAAGNATAAQLRLNVSFDAILIKDIGRRNLPTIQPSTTLEALLNRP